jgi:hypothetical protein
VRVWFAEVSNSWISKFVNPPAFGVEVLLDILNDKQQKERYNSTAGTELSHVCVVCVVCVCVAHG